MKGGLFGFSRKEVLVYNNHNEKKYGQITRNSHTLVSLQDITQYATNIQRGSLNLIIYANNPAEIQSVKVSILVNRDSLRNKLNQLTQKDQIDSSLLFNIEEIGSKYLALNNQFLKLISDSVKTKTPESFNVDSMRPALRKFTDLTRQSGKTIANQTQEISNKKLNVFLQYEFWILAIVLIPYFYFLFRFLYLVIKMIIWDISA